MIPFDLIGEALLAVFVTGLALRFYSIEVGGRTIGTWIALAAVAIVGGLLLVGVMLP